VQAVEQGALHVPVQSLDVDVQPEGVSVDVAQVLGDPSTALFVEATLRLEFGYFIFENSIYHRSSVLRVRIYPNTNVALSQIKT
jgi:hypothetical protein